MPLRVLGKKPRDTIGKKWKKIGKKSFLRPPSKTATAGP